MTSERPVASPGEERDFPSFPFPPYDIQLGFMRALYSALDHGGIGLFESPTGTGKTLSLICSSLTWLQDARKLEKEVAEAEAAAIKEKQDAADAADDIPDWMSSFASQQEEQRKKQDAQDREKRIAKAKARLIVPEAIQKNDDHAAVEEKGKVDDDNVDSEFLLEGVVDDDDGGGFNGGDQNNRKRRSLHVSFDSDEEEDGSIPFREMDEPEPPKKIQIIFASRTHSQLSQFVGELNRTPFADTMSLVALGSRRALCINEDVLRLKSAGLINERCLDLQKPSSSTSKKKALATISTSTKKSTTAEKKENGKCVYLSAAVKSADLTRDMILAQPIDIEALAALGKKRGVCPYYAARKATPEADVILAPYAALLVEDTRRALGLQLEGNVIIIDEAHNLADAINGAHSAELSAATAATAHRQLSAYFERFRTQLTAVNARNVQTLMRAADALAKAAAATAAPSSQSQTQSSSGAQAFSVNDFLFSSGVDNVNMFQLVRHIKQSKAVFKVAGFWQAAQRRAVAAAATNEQPLLLQNDDNNNNNNTLSNDGSATGALHSLLSFLQALTNENADGRVICDPTSGTLKYVLLNAAAHFAAVVASARTVILASGTLSPLDTVLQLFPGVSEQRIHKYACGHVVGRERLLAVAVGSGPGGGALDFRHATRGKNDTIDELGRLVINACTTAPGGVVVFFPSFSYAEQVHARWATSGMLHVLGERKKVFQEPRTAQEVVSVLEEYSTCIQNAVSPVIEDSSRGGKKKQCSGAIMLCVVGGKLAEGINFGDDLGRLVIMVGLPYPNPSDPELQERLKFVDAQVSNSTTTSGTIASREHYSNLCMKAVNQCIGRVIRHRTDYAAVLLVDVRYAAAGGGGGDGEVENQQQFNGVLLKLPGWIQQSLVVCPKFGEAYGRLVRFYKGMVAAAVPKPRVLS